MSTKMTMNVIRTRPHQPELYIGIESQQFLNSRLH